MPMPRVEAGVLGTMLALDAVTAQIAAELERVGVPVILLKGPTISRWLYDGPTERPYDDVDVLVREEDLERAEAVLEEIGFRFVHDDWHGRIWLRGSINVDLHRRVVGLGADPRDAFDVILESAEPFDLGRGWMRMPSAPVRTLNLALHAAQHGPGLTHPLEDLRRGIKRVPEETWREASAAARELDAEEGFASGLDLLPEGTALRNRLGFEPQVWTGVPELTTGLLRFAATKGAKEKTTLVVHEVFPTRDYLRAHYSLARRGRGGLLAARAWRPVSLLIRLGPALSALVALRRQRA
jgi:Uncharacterised nucleotidyltransferase